MKREYTVGISLTEKCNLKCNQCYIGRKKLWTEKGYSAKEITLKQIESLIPKLKKANVHRINFGGGEAPLHRDFIKISELLYNAGMKISLTTNGTTFNVYKNYLDLFNDIGVSIDFPDERHSELRGVKGIFSKAVNTLNNLVGSGVKTELVSCIMSINYNELPKLYELCNNIGVDMWRLNRFHSSKNDLLRFKNEEHVHKQICKINNYLSCSRKQMENAFNFLASVTPPLQNYAIPDPLFRTFVNGKGVTKGSPCGKIAFRIKSNGDVTPNVFTDDIAGNIFIDDIEDVLKSISFYNYLDLKPKRKCIGCVNYEFCQGGDITDSYLLKNDIRAPDPYCFLKPKEKKAVELLDINKTNFVHETYLGTIYVPIKFRGLKNENNNI